MTVYINSDLEKSIKHNKQIPSINCVVSRYNEDTTWALGFKCNNDLYRVDQIYVYDKENPNNQYNIPVNKGNEASVYLRYIVDHYDSLADYTFFTHSEEFSWHHSGSLINKLSEAVLSNKDYFNVNS